MITSVKKKGDNGREKSKKGDNGREKSKKGDNGRENNIYYINIV